MVELKSNEEASKEADFRELLTTPVYSARVKVQINEGLKRSADELTSEDGADPSELSRVLKYGAFNKTLNA